MSSPSGSAARMHKLRWMCRRGMKELDVLLEQFLGENERALSDGEYPELETLLACEDDVLWDCLRGARRPDDSRLEPVVRAISDVRGSGH